jgi:hypothetical protein
MVVVVLAMFHTPQNILLSEAAAAGRVMVTVLAVAVVAGES